jgi:hypothetical protein
MPPGDRASQASAHSLNFWETIEIEIKLSYINYKNIKT